MKKLTELLYLNKTSGIFGIEIEVEGKNLVNLHDDRHWRSEPDGSLRKGIEYVMKSPSKLAYIAQKLRYLQKKLEDNSAELDFSFRTSVHVHVNVQEFTHVQILNMIYTYLLIEAPLMDFCGESRKGNRFCLRVEDAEGMVDILARLFKNGPEDIRNIPHDKMRYAALNVEALTKYGSLEFRALQGNLNVAKITTWCKILNKIREFAMNNTSPSEVFNRYTELEAEGFLKAVLGEFTEIVSSEHTLKDIQRNFSLTIDLPFSFFEWEKVNKKKELVKEKSVQELLVAKEEAFYDAIRGIGVVQVAEAPIDWRPVAPKINRKPHPIKYNPFAG